MKMNGKFGGKYRYFILALTIFAIGFFIYKYYKYSEIISDDNVYPELYDSISAINPDDTGQSANQGKEISHLNTLPLAIQASENFKNYERIFTIPNDTLISIHAVGEAADYNTNPNLFNSFDNDGIEFFFDMKNSKSHFFDILKFDRQYRILWSTLKMDGKNFNAHNVKVVERDPNSSTYFMEVTFPWESLGGIRPMVNSKIGFDLSIMDSDGGSMKGKLTWNNENDDNWMSTSNYGSLVLAGSSQNSPRKGVVFAKKRPTLGKASHYAQHSSLYYECKHVTVGFVKDSLDLSGKFQAEWDSKNLYLKVKVRDNIKTYSKALFDYGWIENSKGDTLWRMNNDNLKPAGGALKNKQVDTTIRIKKGIYHLNYHTDESHSPIKWDAAPPDSDFYGIRISYVKSNDGRKYHPSKIKHQ